MPHGLEIHFGTVRIPGQMWHNLKIHYTAVPHFSKGTEDIIPVERVLEGIRNRVRIGLQIRFLDMDDPDPVAQDPDAVRHRIPRGAGGQGKVSGVHTGAETRIPQGIQQFRKFSRVGTL